MLEVNVVTANPHWRERRSVISSAKGVPHLVKSRRRIREETWTGRAISFAASKLRDRSAAGGSKTRRSRVVGAMTLSELRWPPRAPRSCLASTSSRVTLTDLLLLFKVNSYAKVPTIIRAQRNIRPTARWPTTTTIKASPWPSSLKSVLSLLRSIKEPSNIRTCQKRLGMVPRPNTMHLPTYRLGCTAIHRNRFLFRFLQADPQRAQSRRKPLPLLVVPLESPVRRV